MSATAEGNGARAGTRRDDGAATDPTNPCVLDAGRLRALGVPEGWRFGLSDRVRFGELDAFGHANHTAYLTWYENIRTHYFPVHGLCSFDASSNKPVVRTMTADYLMPLGLNDRYVVTARTVELRRTSFRMGFAVWCDGQMAASCETVFVLLAPDGARPVAIPEDARRRLIEIDGARQA